MLEPLYEKAIKKKDNIGNYMDNAVEKIDKEKVKRVFNEYDFKVEDQIKNFIALDGSFNRVKYMGFFIYAICSQAIVSYPKEGIKKEATAGDVDTISSTNARNIDKILSQHMNILELKSAIATLNKYKDIDYVLMDGSIRGTLMNVDTNYELPNKLKDKMKAISFQYIEEKLYDNDFEIEVSAISQKISEFNDMLNQIEKSEDIDSISVKEDLYRYFEALEQLECIYVLLKEYNKKVICISKTSTTKDLLNEEIPDAAILDYFFNRPGFTHPVHKASSKLVRDSINKKILVNYPIHNKMFSEDIDYTVFFARLSPNSNILKIELPYHANEQEIIEIIEYLKSTAIDGYPYILKKAHNEVVIKNRDMSTLITLLDIHEKNGREVLKVYK